MKVKLHLSLHTGVTSLQDFLASEMQWSDRKTHQWVWGLRYIVNVQNLKLYPKLPVYWGGCPSLQIILTTNSIYMRQILCSVFLTTGFLMLFQQMMHMYLSYISCPFIALCSPHWHVTSTCCLLLCACDLSEGAF